MDKYEKMLARQRDRAIAILLDYKERECDSYLPNEVSRFLRKAILDQLNDFHLFCKDLIDAIEGEKVVLNDEYLERFNELYDYITGPEE